MRAVELAVTYGVAKISFHKPHFQNGTVPAGIDPALYSVGGSSDADILTEKAHPARDTLVLETDE